LNLTENDLTDMGITLFGPRKKLLNVIKQYKERGILAVEPDLAIGEATRDPSSSNNIIEKKSASLKVLYEQTLGLGLFADATVADEIFA
jgi:hypothetical protein